MNELYDKIENWIKENHKSAEHLVRTVFWLERIYPKADDAMKIAAVAHDMERAFPMQEGEVMPDGLSWKDFENEKYLLWHGERSARFLSERLKKMGADSELVNDAAALVVRHEVGGSEREDAIKDADSISFLEINAAKFIKDIPERLTKEEAKAKFDCMYCRISSKEAQEFARPFYENAINDLKNI